MCHMLWALKDSGSFEYQWWQNCKDQSEESMGKPLLYIRKCTRIIFRAEQEYHDNVERNRGKVCGKWEFSLKVSEKRPRRLGRHIRSLPSFPTL